MFRIIGLETLSADSSPVGYGLLNLPDFAEPYRKELEGGKKARYQSVMRVLQAHNAPQVYMFCKDYEIKDGRIRRKQNSVFLDDFFNMGGININVCAIVGENGSGKSTIIELILRLLNNVAYAMSPCIDNNMSYELHFAECVFARLYFEDTKGVVQVIEQRDHDLLWYYADTRNICWKYDNLTNKIAWMIKDETDRPDVENCQSYLTSLFYTIVVNYSAYALNIEDYRAEWSDNDEKKAIKYHRFLTEEEISTQVEQEPAPDGEMSDEERCWIGSLFHKNDAYQTPIVLNPYRIKGNIDYNRERNLLYDRLFLLMLADKNAVTAMLGGKEPYSFVFDKNNELLPENTVHGIFLCRKTYNALQEMNALNIKLDPNGQPGATSIKQPTRDKVARLMNELGAKIVDCWEKCLGFTLIDDINTLSIGKDQDTIAAINYVVYKTIKCTYNYSTFRKFQRNIIAAQNLDELVMRLYCDKSHMTLKLRRALALLVFGHYGTTMIVEDGYLSHTIKLDMFHDRLYSSLSDQKSIIEKCTSERPKLGAYDEGLFNSFGLTNKSSWELEELMPSTALKCRMMLQLQDCSVIGFDTLSSGERQILNSIGTVVYQMHNINSVSNDKIQYKCVNIIFDEIELYFHPNFQKILIERLLDAIGRMNLTLIQHINIIIATHSPFILSDIPQNNIMYLRNGKDVSDDVNMNPLGANINDILHQSFFLRDGFMGEHVKRMIKQLVDAIYSGKINEDNENKYWNLLTSLGDPFIKHKLMDEYITARARNNGDFSIESWLHSKLEEIKKQ